MSDLISNLGINWKLIIAQLVNFAILVFVLNKFLYQPILNVLEKRKQEVKNHESLKKDLNVKLEEIKETEKQVLNEARISSNKILEDTEKQALDLKNKITEETRVEAEKIKTNANREILLEKNKTISEIKKEIGSVLSLAIEKTLGDTLDKNAQEKLGAKALEKIRE